MASGDLVEDGSMVCLLKPVSFSTPCGAVGFVFGGSSNGRIEWKDGDKKTLDALYGKQVAARMRLLRRILTRNYHGTKKDCLTQYCHNMSKIDVYHLNWVLTCAKMCWQ